MARLTLFGFIALLCTILAFAQNPNNGSPSHAVHNENGATPAPQSPFRVDVDLVLLHASVTDSNNRYVTGLSRGHFRLWEDKVEQQIDYFSTENVPLSVGIIFDTSGSMETKLDAARAAAATFLRTGDRDDEYFLIEFSDTPRLGQDFTTDITKLQSRFLFTQARGSTSLYDALYLGLDRVTRGTNGRKALLLITDGQDNHSRYRLGDVKSFAREHDVAIYSIGIEDGADAQIAGLSGRSVLTGLADLSGGMAFFPRSLDALPAICEQIGFELKNQYVLGYRSHNPNNDGRWRKIRLKVNPPAGLAPVTVRAKAGYYASAVAAVLK